MDPSISNITETNNVLSYTLKGVNVSIANSLRRISTEIPSVVFRTTPYEKNNAKFEENTTRMNNELIKIDMLVSSALDLKPDIERVARAENYVEDGKIDSRRD